jgi:putative methanogen marker protein 4
MDAGFIERLREEASRRHARIGIGASGGGRQLLDGLDAASEYAEIVLVGDPGCDCDLEVMDADDPATLLVDLLAKGEIDGAVRGNVSAHRAMRNLSRTFKVKVRRLALLELSGWSFFLAPVGIDEGETIQNRLDLVVLGARYIEKMGILPKVAVLSGGRLEDLGRSERVDRSLADSELIAMLAEDAGVLACHKGILIETCRGDDLIVAPDGISGNLIFRTLMLLSGARGYGAPVIMDQVFVDSSRAREDFLGPIMLASALSGMRERAGE